MIRDQHRRNSRSAGSGSKATAAPRRKSSLAPVIEPLEGRWLLTHFYSGATAVRPVQTHGGVYTITMNGPGLVNVSQLGHGVVGVKLYGTTSATEVDIGLSRQRLHQAETPLEIGSIKVLSGQVGAINAPGTELLGTITPLAGSVNSLQFGSLGPNARIDVAGALGSLSVGAVDLGPNGHVRIGGNLGQTLSVGGPMVLDGGQFVVGNDLNGALDVGSLQVNHGGQFVVGHDLSGGASVAGDVSLSNNGLFSVGNDLGGLNITGGLNLDSSGQFVVGKDLVGAVTLGKGLSLSNSAKFSVGRDVPGSLAVNGDMTIATKAAFSVRRDLNSLTVNGNLTIAPTGAMTVGGNLNTLQVNGMLQGQNSKTAIDLNVGLDIGQFTVIGGMSGQGSISQANIEVGKSIVGLDIRHGIFNSLITAGVSINGGSGAPSGGNIGPDGADAIYNSQLLAVVDIDNLTINGNVRSTFATNPASTGYPTRIVTGVDRAGNYTSASVIDNFQITGQLIDSVLAASVAPYGGNGTLPTFAYGAAPPSVGPPPGDGGANTYDAPAGTITGGTVGAPVTYATYTPLTYYNETRTGVKWDATTDPTIDDTILPGQINPSFASAPLAQSALADPTSVLPLPTKSTVLGGVVSTVHGDSADFAGILAADARGVFIGPIPQ